MKKILISVLVISVLALSCWLLVGALNTEASAEQQETERESEWVDLDDVVNNQVNSDKSDRWVRSLEQMIQDMILNMEEVDKANFELLHDEAQDSFSAKASIKLNPNATLSLSEQQLKNVIISIIEASGNIEADDIFLKIE
jgi:hypothetical protein